MDRIREFYDKLLEDVERYLNVKYCEGCSEDVKQLFIDVFCNFSELQGNGEYLYDTLKENLQKIVDFYKNRNEVKSVNDVGLLLTLKYLLYEAFVECEKFQKEHILGKTYFISGHRDITQEEFDRLYKPAILKIIDQDYKCKFVVGDYHGVDTMAQQFLSDLCQERPHKIGPKQVTVYHMFDTPRNYVNVKFNIKGGYKDDIDRDSAMTRESDEDIAFVRKGKQKSGTAQNIVRRHSFE